MENSNIPQTLSPRDERVLRARRRERSVSPPPREPPPPRTFSKAMPLIRRLHAAMHVAGASGQRYTEASERMTDALWYLLYERGQRIDIHNPNLLWPGQTGDGRNLWMPQFEVESPVTYAARLQTSCVSVVDLIYIVRCIEWVDIDSYPHEAQLIGRIVELDKRSFHVGNCRASIGAVPYNTRYAAAHFIEFICNFCVVNARDAGRIMAHADMPHTNELLAMLCTRVARVRGPTQIIYLGAYGPAVVYKRYEAAFVLVARHDYAAGDFVTLYGGQRLSHDPRTSYETADERRAHCSDYIVPGFVDGELFFRLTDTGRFMRRAAERVDLINTALVWTPHGTLAVRTTRSVASGEELWRE